MAQLVKLQDYISRYQIDLARYPTQFVRLKKTNGSALSDSGNWEKILASGNMSTMRQKRRLTRKKNDFPS